MDHLEVLVIFLDTRLTRLLNASKTASECSNATQLEGQGTDILLYLIYIFWPEYCGRDLPLIFFIRSKLIIFIYVRASSDLDHARFNSGLSKRANRRSRFEFVFASISKFAVVNLQLGVSRMLRMTGIWAWCCRGWQSLESPWWSDRCC